MRSTARNGSALSRITTKRAAAAALLAAGLGSGLMAGTAGAASTGSHHARPHSSGTVIMAATGTFGPMLVVGAGPEKGLALYAITSDYGSHFGCGPTPVQTNNGPVACTGPSNSQSAEWPALTTSGAPVAGKGLNRKLIGEVKRKGIGEQVTYGGHPLYLFDSIPGVLTGEAWDESTRPPWHGVWYLVSPHGNFQAPAGTLTTTKTTGGATVVAAVMTVGGGQFAFPLYSLKGAASCAGSCVETWSPLLMTGSPGLLNGLSRRLVGSVRLANGTSQVTYDHKPLYLYGDEALTKATGVATAEGNGNGVAAPKPAKGTFDLVKP